MGQSMLPDVIEYDFRRTGLRREGIFSGLYSVVEKVASTLAPSILLLTYAWFGFNAKAPTQTEATIDGIRYAAAFLPCLYLDCHCCLCGSTDSPNLNSNRLRPL